MARIYKRGGVYYSDLFLGGKRIRKPLSTDKKIAEEKMAEMVRVRASGKYHHAPISEIRLEFFLKEYLPWLKQTAKKSTWHQHDRAFRHLQKRLGLMTLSQITSKVLDQYQALRKADGMTNETINREIGSIRSAVKRAAVWYNLEPPQLVFKRLEEKKGRLIWWTPEQIHKLASTTKDPWRMMIYFGVYTGVRLGELVHVRREDVVLDEDGTGWVQVTPTKFWTPKDYEKRDIPIPPPFYPMLKAYLDHSRIKSGLLFPYTESVASAYIRKLVRKAKLIGSTHTLRHTYGTWLGKAGVDSFIIKQLMGHSKIETTMRYVHLDPADLQRGAEKLPDLSGSYPLPWPGKMQDIQVRDRTN